MSDATTPLQAALRLRRQAIHEQACRQVLAGLDVELQPDSVLAIPEVDALFRTYIDRVAGADASRWVTDDVSLLQTRLDMLANALEARKAVWIALANNEPAGLVAPVGPLLRSATSYLVTRAGDLMLVSDDAVDGLCVERNYSDGGDYFEVAAWGAFEPAVADPEPGSAGAG